MSVETLYVLRRGDPPIRDLGAVMLLADALTDEGDTISGGTEGTVVHVTAEGTTLIVEFAEPEGALATLPASAVVRVGRTAP